MPHKICMTNPEGEPVFYNDSWLNYTGKSMKELLNISWYSLIDIEDIDRVEQAVNDSLESGDDLELELRILDKNVEAKWHLVKATAIVNEEGSITSWITSSTEIQKLKEEEQRKEGFLKLVSHELKTPVTSIKGYVQLLLSILQESTEKEDSPFKPYLNRIETQVERLIRLISEMLDLSRIEQNELELKKEKFFLNELVEHIIEDISFSNKEVQIELDYFCECEVYADKDRIGQVIINFITNALKYSPNGNRVNVKVFNESETNVGVSVKDFGIGIDNKELNKIFNRFYRVATKNDNTYAGFGIGLYLSDEIIKRHSGKIFVKSELGEGSEFTFTLPIN